MSGFHIGERIACVKDDGYDPENLAYVPNKPVKGCVYTIRGFDTNGGDELGIYLEEIVNPEDDFCFGRQEPSFYAWRFRPVRTTSIDVFTAMLAPTPRIKETV